MRFRQFLERTLYHGTIVDYEPSIRELGLYGQMGDFQQSAYDDPGYGEPTENDEVVFMTDKQKLGRAVTAMVHHIAKKLRKGFHDVTDDDIRNHGLLCVAHDMRGPQDVAKKRWEEPDVSQRPEDEDERGVEYPRGAEPGDYYTPEMMPDQFVKGNGLLRLLQRYGEWPRNYGEEGYRSRNDKLQGMLVAAMLRQHPEVPKETIMRAVQNQGVKPFLDKYLPQWQKHS